MSTCKSCGADVRWVKTLSASRSRAQLFAFVTGISTVLSVFLLVYAVAFYFGERSETEKLRKQLSAASGQIEALKKEKEGLITAFEAFMRLTAPAAETFPNRGNSAGKQKSLFDGGDI